MAFTEKDRRYLEKLTSWQSRAGWIAGVIAAAVGFLFLIALLGSLIQYRELQRLYQTAHMDQHGAQQLLAAHEPVTQEQVPVLQSYARFVWFSTATVFLFLLFICALGDHRNRRLLAALWKSHGP